MNMRYRAQHWKDVPGVKYPEPPPEPQPPEGWLTGREAAEVLGWVFRPDISTRLHKLGVRCEQWKPAGRPRQLVWCAEDVANAQNARKNAPQAKVASVPARTGKHGGRQAAKGGKKQM